MASHDRHEHAHGHTHAHHPGPAHAHEHGACSGAHGPAHASGARTGRAEPAPAREDVEYTCPMHPEIRQIGPGSCPICGMALEPVVATAEVGESAELRDMTRRFWIGLVLTLPVFVLEMGGHLTNLNHLLGQQLSNWIQLVLATPVVLWAGWPFFVRAVASVTPIAARTASGSWPTS